MKTGTKSILFGYHQFLLHPLFVALAWWKLYYFPLNPKLWIAFFVHDLGYWGKSHMDDAKGETHPELGARIIRPLGEKWSDFCLLHSRFYSNRLGQPYSDLCPADKLAFCLYPTWLIEFLYSLSGEGEEYKEIAIRRELVCSNATITDVISMWKDQSLLWLEQHEMGEGNKMIKEMKELDSNPKGQ